jgi:hypothetical protein
MTDRNISLRGSSQDRPTYRHTSISIDTNTLTKINIKSENYYSNRNCPEMLSLFASKNKRLDYRVNQIHNSNDVHNFQTINYSIESSPTSPIPNQGLENDKQPMFPKVTPRVNLKSLDLSFLSHFLDCYCGKKVSYFNKQKCSFKC